MQSATPGAPEPIPRTPAQRCADNDDIAACIGACLYAGPTDKTHLDTFEKSLGRKVSGMYPQLFGGSLKALLQPEIDALRQLPSAAAGEQAPNAAMRRLVHRGLPRAILNAATDDRLAELQTVLQTPAFLALPVSATVHATVRRRLAPRLEELRGMLKPMNRIFVLGRLQHLPAAQEQAFLAALQQHLEQNQMAYLPVPNLCGLIQTLIASLKSSFAEPSDGAHTALMTTQVAFVRLWQCLRTAIYCNQFSLQQQTTLAPPPDDRWLAF